MAAIAPAAGGASGTGGSVAKAFLQVVDGGGAPTEGGPASIPHRLDCTYNPTTLKVSGGADWRAGEDQAGARDVTTAQFSKSKPRSLSVELFLDEREGRRGNVVEQVETLFAWTRPRQYQERIRAPYLRFQWGSQPYFHCYLTDVNVTYKLFRQDGTPLRASVTVSLTEVVDPSAVQSQNPTSGGPGGRRAHTVAQGESLPSIAHAHYGRPALWRGLAVFNAIDDPLRLRPGQRVLIPTATEAAELS